MYRIKDECPLCQQGSVGVFKTTDKTLVLMCEECNGVWLNPNTIDKENALYPEIGCYQVPGYDWSLSGEGTGWATDDEVKEKGWCKS